MLRPKSLPATNRLCTQKGENYIKFILSWYEWDRCIREAATTIARMLRSEFSPAMVRPFPAEGWKLYQNHSVMERMRSVYQRDGHHNSSNAEAGVVTGHGSTLSAEGWKLYQNHSVMVRMRSVYERDGHHNSAEAGLLTGHGSTPPVEGMHYHRQRACSNLY
ncbi:hypothetical protein AVEN_89637-1 [Araneus ventricosus]|uniref:Uncharacterized protein n=1 Tax=Araneus ventricosus TaxID=182803 RepID=A0A4Y2EVV5_ARAVE|nr:hypothetical protein AVEN_89637-1 [Araneus ventricosus]